MKFLRFAYLAALALAMGLPAQADEPRPRPAAAAPVRPASPSRAAPSMASPSRPEGPMFAPRPGGAAQTFARPTGTGFARPVDGRGQVLDGRYNHGRYYPAPGTVARSLPSGYRPYYRGGQPYYFNGGVWYAPRAGGFVVVAPPVGLVVSALPSFCSTVWIGGAPYYYADSVYYAWQPDQNGYAVVNPPDGAGDASAQPPDASDDAAQSAQPSSGQSDVFIYPKNGQSKDQQAADEYECHDWARSQTGFDPADAASQGDAGGPPPEALDRLHGNYDRAMNACLQGRGYQVN